MAKKKPAATKKTKPTKKKPVRTKSAAKPANAKTTKAKKKSSPTSVDGILGAFEKERVAQASNLVAVRKKIEQLTKNVAKMKSDLESLKKEAVETELAIETIDSRRDKEVGALLSSLGVDLGKAASAAKQKPPVDLGTPLFDDDSKKSE
jgi:predicted  nucleic acid-binding Zn-ribbon protein